MEREALRNLMKAKRKEIHDQGDVVSVDIKCKNNYVEDEEGDDAEEPTPRHVAKIVDTSIESNNSEDELETDSINENSTELVEENNDEGEGDDLNEYEDNGNLAETVNEEGGAEIGGNQISNENDECSDTFDCSSSFESEDSLSHDHTFDFSSDNRDETAAFEENCFDDLNVSNNDQESRESISPEIPPSLEYSALLSQMQEILKLPNCMKKASCAPMHNISTTIEIHPIEEGDESSSMNEEPAQSPEFSEDDDEFEEEIDFDENIDFNAKNDKEVGESSASDSQNLDFYLSGADSTVSNESPISWKEATGASTGADAEIKVNSDDGENIVDLTECSLDLNHHVFNVTSYHGVNEPLTKGGFSATDSQHGNEWNDQAPSENSPLDKSEHDIVDPLPADASTEFEGDMDDLDSIRQFLVKKLGSELLGRATAQIQTLDSVLSETEDSASEDRFLDEMEQLVGVEGLQYLDLLYRLASSDEFMT